VDTVNSSINYTLFANVENLVLTGSANAGTGNALANTITGNVYSNVLDGASGADAMAGGKGNDIYVVDNVGDVVSEAANEGVDTVQSSVSFALATNVENLTLTGTAGINGSGNASSNTLTGNSAANALAGGAGDDTYVVGAGDSVIENANEGVDTVQTDVTFSLGANVENLTLTGYAAVNATGNSLDNLLAGNSSANVLTGGAGDDIYVVSVGDTVVELANQGIDTVRSEVTYTLGANVENLTLINGYGSINGTGNGLDNVLTGNNSANVLTGAAGNDTYVVAAGDTVIEALNEGTDTVLASVTYTLTNSVENVALTGAAAIDATGNSLDNILTGNAANNALDGQLGKDRMAGGAGDDTYWIDDVGDVVTENTTEGTDTVQSFIDYTLGANLENLSLNSVLAVMATGNELNNVITGTTADNVLTGLGGDDSLDGRLGADTMIGGIGNDNYVVDSIDDEIVENLNEGIDTVQSKLDCVLGAHLENLALLGIAAVYGTGNGLGNVLTGGVGDNVLNGGAGADTMSGGRGNDTYHVDNVGDGVIENASEGSDSVFSSVSFTLTANVENLTLTGSDAINGVGNASDNILIGNNASNVLSASGGNNYFDGGAGADSLRGGSGNDIYVVDDLGDVIQDTSGYDTVHSSVNFWLAPSLENLTLTGSGAIDGAGNVNANVLIGNASANVLDGGGSADTMLAGGGDDTYIVDDIGDWVGEYAVEGIDTVRSSVTFALGVNVENLELTGNTAIGGTDNALDNTLIGNTANNQLRASDGNDTLVGGGGADMLADSTGDNVLIGGAGSDALQGGTGSDVFAFNRGDGVDLLADAGGGVDTLSIGGGIGYASMTLGKAGNDLLFALGAGEQIVLKDWYANVAQRSVTNLQVIAQAMSDFNPGGGDSLRDHNIEEFDFAGLVGRFDQALVAKPSIASWALSGVLGECHTSGSDTAVIGGDAVLQYGLSGQIPVVGDTSTLAPAVLVSASAGSNLLATASPSDLMASSMDMLFGPSVDTAPSGGTDSTGGAAHGLLTEHRLDPSVAMRSGEVAASALTDGGTLPPSIDVAIHGSANAPAGGIPRGNSATSASSSGHGAGAEQEHLRVDAGHAANVAAVNAWGRPDISRSEPRALSSNDVLSERIDRALDHWVQAKDTSPTIRLSSYDEVLRGASVASEDTKGCVINDVSYSSRWQRLRFLLNQHVSTFGDVAASDLGPRPWSRDAMSGILGDGTSVESKLSAHRASARTPLPMFSGLQDGFDRL
jgi:Ca2+-binding RTX toxin-like protein